MKHAWKLAVIALAALAVLACSDDYDPLFDAPRHIDPELQQHLATISGAVSCSAKLQKYPVKGPHNGGWDPNALKYSCPPHPSNAKDNSDWIAGDHYGNDIFAAKGTPLVACRDGIISNIATTSIGGKNVTIKDSCGWYYYYAHMNTFASGLKQGQSVKAGDALGTVGNTGNASGTSPHLHFSIFPGNYTSGINPFPLLQTVDAGACSGGGGTTPAAKPIIEIWSKTNATDTLPQGASSGIFDVFESDEFVVNVYIRAKASGAKPDGQIKIGYWIEQPWIQPVTYKIYTDWPAKNQSTWKVNDSDSAPGNPSKTNMPKSGQINIYALSPGETKRIRFVLKANKYSIGAVDHPDLRAWVWHVANFYGEMTGFYDTVETNKAGKLLRTYTQLDVYGKTHWEWNGTKPELEGWTIANKVTTLAVNTSAHCLAIEQGGQDPYIRSPKISLSAATWKGFNARIRHYEGPKQGQLFWITNKDTTWNEAKSIVFEAQGDGEFHKVVLNTASNPLWKNTITRIRLDPTLKSTKWYDIDWLRAVQTPGKTTGDKDGDGVVASKDCNDNDPAIGPSSPEVCDGVDNDCDGQIDEGFNVGPEVCDGVDNDCDGQVDEGTKNACGGCGPPPEEICDGKDNNCDGALLADEADADGDGVLVCKGDCDDTDPEVAAGKPELCDSQDNDCDDQVDEGFDIGAGCTVGKGLCVASGHVACAPDGQAACDVAPLPPSPESCDGLDNDCDGEIDEDFGLGQPCEGGSANCARAGVVVCSADGSEAVCHAPPPDPTPELCNLIDDDCDGEIDEDFALLKSCMTGQGGCASEGYLACDDDGGVFCKAPERDGIAELCDATDNDCDGLVDEGFPVGLLCKTDEGGCTRAGTWACDPTGLETVCVAEGECLGSAGGPGGGDTTASSGGGTGAQGAEVEASAVAGSESSGCAAGAAPWGTSTALVLLSLLASLLLVRRRERARSP